MGSDQWLAVIAILMCLGLVLPGALRARRPISLLLRDIALWLAIALGLGLIYVFVA
jgi:hypothetical protein